MKRDVFHSVYDGKNWSEIKVLFENAQYPDFDFDENSIMHIVMEKELDNGKWGIVYTYLNSLETE